MQLRTGFEMTCQCAQPTPMMLALSIHPSRASDLVRPDRLETDRVVPKTSYLDPFGNGCSRRRRAAGLGCRHWSGSAE